MNDYAFRNGRNSHIYNITWQDIIDCAKSGWTMKDTCFELGIAWSTFHSAIKKRHDVHALFMANAGGRGTASWVARRGYTGGEYTPSNFGTYTCKVCGVTEAKASNTQVVCEKCRDEYKREQWRLRAARARANKSAKTGRKNYQPNPDNHPWKTIHPSRASVMPVRLT